MALPPTIYRATLQLADVDRGCYERLTVTLARHPSETAERLVARLLAYALCYEEGLAFSRGISAGDEPDIWRKAPDGRVATWIEVGLPDAERLTKATRHAGRVILLACGKGLPRWTEQHVARLSALDNLQVFTLEPAFLQALGAHLERGIAWEITITSGNIYLDCGSSSLESPLTWLIGAMAAN